MNSTNSRKEAPVILIVEHDRLIRTQLRQAMEQAGYQVAQATESEQVLTAYTRLNPDLVLLDAFMPVIDGFNCCTQLQALPGAEYTPVLMLIALEDQQSIERAFEAGATDYISKPIHSWVLRQRVRRLLEESQARKELQQQTERERLVSDIIQRISSGCKMEEIVQTTLFEVRQFLRLERVFIYQFVANGSAIVVAESIASSWSTLMGTKLPDFLFGETTSRELHKQHRIQATTDIYTAGLSQEQIDLLTRLQIRANLVVPIVQGQQLWGLLVANQCSNWRQWLQFEINFLKQLATHLALAIQQNQIYEQLQIQLSQRQQAESALRENQCFIQRIVETTPNVLYIYDLIEQRNIYLNCYVREVVGYSEQQIQAMGEALLPTLAHPDDLPRLQQHFQRFPTLTESEIIEIEYRMRHANGEWRWFHSRDTVFTKTADGLPVQILGVAQDITEHKQILENLRQSEQRYRTLVRNFPNGAVFLFDQDLCYKIADGTALATVGLASDLVEGKTMWEVLPSQSCKLLEPIYRAALTGTITITEFPFADRIYSTHALPVENESGEIFAGMIVAQDITERKLAEQKIREQAALLDVTKDAIIVHSLNEDKILFWNKAAEHLYGWTPQQALGQNLNVLLYDQSTLAHLNSLKETTLVTGEWHGELHQFTHDHKKIIVSSRWSVIHHFFDQPISILSVNTDITAKKQLEAQFYQIQRLESLGTLASGIAHDLNNMLSPIVAVAQLLPLKLPTLDQKNQELLKILQDSSQRCVQLVKQITSFARGAQGTQVPLQLQPLLLEIEGILSTTFPKSIALDLNLAQNLSSVCVDDTQIHQVLINLCVNARDAMPHGGTLSICAENFFVDQNYARMNLEANVGPYVVITVTDTGSGMPQEVVSRIFDPFFTTKPQGQGSGLGLSTVVGIINNHGGFVRVHSEVGLGSKFQVYLPAHQDEVATPAVDSLQISAGNSELILVVDDEAFIRQTIKNSLEQHNYRILCATDAIEAFSLYTLHKHEIHLVLIDIQMPSIDGFHAIRILQQINSAVKIIAMSGLADNCKLLEARNIHVQAFLLKPHTLKELLGTIQAVLIQPQ